MTFTEIVADIAERLNQTSSTATTRIGKAVNRHYKIITSSIGMIVGRRTEVSQAASIGIRTITFSGIEKVISVEDRSSGSTRTLQEVTYNEIKDSQMTSSSLPRRWAVDRMGADSVTVLLDCIPDTTFTLYAVGHETKETLSGTDEPAFSESYHDILVEAVLVDEYRKLEKLPLLNVSKAIYDERMAALRMWNAKSSYLDVRQGGGYGLASAYPMGVTVVGGGMGSLGLWNDVEFDATDFTASSGNWTLTSGDLTNFKYMVIGKTIWIQFATDSSTVSATPTYLQIAMPGGYSLATSGFNFTAVAYANDNGTIRGALVRRVNATTLGCQLTGVSATWATSTNATHVYFQGFFELL